MSLRIKSSLTTDSFSRFLWLFYNAWVYHTKQKTKKNFRYQSSRLITKQARRFAGEKTVETLKPFFGKFHFPADTLEHCVEHLLDKSWFSRSENAWISDKHARLRNFRYFFLPAWTFSFCLSSDFNFGVNKTEWNNLLNLNLVRARFLMSIIRRSVHSWLIISF